MRPGRSCVGRCLGFLRRPTPGYTVGVADEMLISPSLTVSTAAHGLPQDAVSAMPRNVEVVITSGHAATTADNRASVLGPSRNVEVHVEDSISSPADTAALRDLSFLSSGAPLLCEADLPADSAVSIAAQCELAQDEEERQELIGRLSRIDQHMAKMTVEVTTNDYIHLSVARMC